MSVSSQEVKLYYTGQKERWWRPSLHTGVWRKLAAVCKSCWVRQWESGQVRNCDYVAWLRKVLAADECWSTWGIRRYWCVGGNLTQSPQRLGEQVSLWCACCYHLLFQAVTHSSKRGSIWLSAQPAPQQPHAARKFNSMQMPSAAHTSERCVRIHPPIPACHRARCLPFV